MSTGPFVVLHDHLDGGLRPRTVMDLCIEPLPASGTEALADWFDQKPSGSLERYLESFRYTLASMTTPAALSRVAREAIEDHYAVGVIHAELRFGPLLIDQLSGEEVVEAVLAGLAEGSATTGVSTGLILCALRHLPDSPRVARLAARYRGEGVVGFDLAGPEAGYPPDEHLEAIDIAREGGVHITLHAGEAAGVESIRRAVVVCGTERIGHGIEIMEDCQVRNGEIVDLGPVAETVHTRGIPLEVCPSSNLATKGWRPDQHPLGMLYRAGFNVTLNTDNRLMSRTSMGEEADLVKFHLGLDDAALRRMNHNAAEAAFVTEERRSELVGLIDDAPG